jgi:hypothetical protein
LRHKGGINVEEVEPFLIYLVAYSFKQDRAPDVSILRIGIRKMFSDVSFSNGSEQSIADGMEKNIRIGVALETEQIGDFNSPQKEGPSRD